MWLSLSILPSPCYPLLLHPSYRASYAFTSPFTPPCASLVRGVVVQLAGPLEPVVVRVGDPFVISVCARVKTPTPAFLVLVSAPSFQRTDPHEPKRSTYPLVTAHVPLVEALGCAADGDPDAVMYRVTLRLASFPRTGFYDWRVVTVDGSGVPIPAVFPSPSGRRVRAAGAATGSGSGLPDGVRVPSGVCQGRYIVHRASIMQENVREVVVDLQVRVCVVVVDGWGAQHGA